MYIFINWLIKYLPQQSFHYIWSQTNNILLQVIIRKRRHDNIKPHHIQTQVPTVLLIQTSQFPIVGTRSQAGLLPYLEFIFESHVKSYMSTNISICVLLCDAWFVELCYENDNKRSQVDFNGLDGSTLIASCQDVEICWLDFVVTKE